MLTNARISSVDVSAPTPTRMTGMKLNCFDRPITAMPAVFGVMMFSASSPPVTMSSGSMMSKKRGKSVAEKLLGDNATPRSGSSEGVVVIGAGVEQATKTNNKINRKNSLFILLNYTR